MSVRVNQRQKNTTNVVRRYLKFRCIPTESVSCLASRYTVHAELKTEIRCCIAASGKQVRECGARVNNEDLISRSAQSSWYISALPQYLERFAARYTNPLRVNDFLQICRHWHSASGFEFVRSTNKKRKTPTSECLSFFVGDPYGNRTHVFSVRG